MEETANVYDGEAKLSDLKAFIKSSLWGYRIQLGLCINGCVVCSMGLAGVRTPDNRQYFDAKNPLTVVYFDIDYEHNAKGEHDMNTFC